MPGVWTRSEIESLADPGSFLRGVGYQRGGRVDCPEFLRDFVPEPERRALRRVGLHKGPPVRQARHLMQTPEM